MWAFGRVFGGFFTVSSKEISLDNVYASIGQICALWVEIEVSVDSIIQHIAAANHLVPTGEGEVVYVMLQNMDIREKTEALKALAFIHFGDSTLLSETQRLMSLVGQCLRNTRNRMIHDAWKQKGDAIIQRRRTTRLSRTPSTAELRLHMFDDITHEDESKINDAIHLFEETLSGLYALYLRFLLEKAQETASISSDPSEEGRDK